MCRAPAVPANRRRSGHNLVQWAAPAGTSHKRFDKVAPYQFSAGEFVWTMPCLDGASASNQAGTQHHPPRKVTMGPGRLCDCSDAGLNMRAQFFPSPADGIPIEPGSYQCVWNTLPRAGAAPNRALQARRIRRVAGVHGRRRLVKPF
jgi:hypothetical protein